MRGRQCSFAGTPPESGQREEPSERGPNALRPAQYVMAFTQKGPG